MVLHFNPTKSSEIKRLSLVTHKARWTLLSTITVTPNVQNN